MQAVRFANDHAMIAKTEEGLQRMMDETSTVVEKCGMKINIKKNEIMKIFQ